MDGALHFKEDDVILCFSSLYWLSGVLMLLTGPLLGPTRIITTDSFTPERLLNITEKYKVSYHILTDFCFGYWRMSLKDELSAANFKKPKIL